MRDASAHRAGGCREVVCLGSARSPRGQTFPRNQSIPLLMMILQGVHSGREGVDVLHVDVHAEQAHPRDRMPGCDLKSRQITSAEPPALAMIIPPFRRELP